MKKVIMVIFAVVLLVTIPVAVWSRGSVFETQEEGGGIAKILFFKGGSTSGNNTSGSYGTTSGNNTSGSYGTTSGNNTSGSYGTTSGNNTSGSYGTTSGNNTSGSYGTTSGNNTSGNQGTTSGNNTSGNQGTTSGNNTSGNQGTTSGNNTVVQEKTITYKRLYWKDQYVPAIEVETDMDLSDIYFVLDLYKDNEPYDSKILAYEVNGNEISFPIFHNMIFESGTYQFRMRCNRKVAGTLDDHISGLSTSVVFQRPEISYAGTGKPYWVEDDMGVIAFEGVGAKRYEINMFLNSSSILQKIYVTEDAQAQLIKVSLLEEIKKIEREKWDGYFQVSVRALSDDLDTIFHGPMSICSEILNTKSNAYGTVVINEENFPDAIFRNCVKANFDRDENGSLCLTELNGVTSMNVTGNFEDYRYGRNLVTSLKGIEYFKNLEELSCGNNGITSLDLSQNTKLHFLDCSFNKISNLNISQCGELKKLNARYNSLSEIDLSNNAALMEVDLNGNSRLSTLDVSRLTALAVLKCEEDSIQALDVSQNKELQYLGCSFNQIAKLDLSNNTKLEILWVTSNPMGKIDLSNNLELMEIHVGGIGLTELDVSKNIKLRDLDCYNNQLEKVEFGGIKNIASISCHMNPMTTFPITQFPALVELMQNGNRKTFQVNGNTYVRYEFVTNGNSAIVISPEMEEHLKTQIKIANSIDSSNNAEYAVKELQENVSADSLVTAMQEDEVALQQLQQLEERYTQEKQITVGIVVGDNAKDLIDQSKVTMVGGALNAQSGENVTLSISKPEKEQAVNENYYKNGVQLDIKLLSGNDEKDALKVPVKITLPVPAGINLDKLIIIHYLANGKTQKVEWKDNGDGTISFVLTDFSTFLLAEQGEEKEPAVMNSALATFEGKIGVVYRLELPYYVLNDSDAYVILTKNGKEFKMMVSEAIPEVVNGKNLYRFTKYVVAKEYRENINLRLFDGNGNPITLKGGSGKDYTETGVDYSLETYIGKKKDSSDAKMAALAVALEDYCTAAQIYFNYNADGLSASGAVKAVTADALEGYKGVFEGEMPAGMNGRSIKVAFESDNAFKMLYTFDDNVDPKSFSYTIDGKAATLHSADGENYLMTANVAAKNLDKVNTYTISKDGVTYTVKCSVLTYARSSVLNGTEARQNLGKALYLYNRAASAYFTK